MLKKASLKQKRRAYQRGLWAEYVALWWLRLKGYRLLKRRFRCPFGEIDLILRFQDSVVAVEVKQRGTYQKGIEVLNLVTLQRMQKSLCFFLTQQGQTVSLNLRCDAVIVSKWKMPLHIQNITV